MEQHGLLSYDEIAEQLAIRLSAEEGHKREQVLQAIEAERERRLKEIEADAEAYIAAVLKR